MIPPKHFDISPPRTGGCSEGLDAFRLRSRCVQIFLEQQKQLMRPEYFKSTEWYIPRWDESMRAKR